MAFNPYPIDSSTSKDLGSKALSIVRSTIYLSFATAESCKVFFLDGLSMDSTLRSPSPSQSSVAAIEQDDRSSSLRPQTDTDSRNEGEIGETTESQLISIQSAPSVAQNYFIYDSVILIDSNVGNITNVTQILRNVSRVSTKVSNLGGSVYDIYDASTPANSATPQRHQQHPTSQTSQTPRTSGNVHTPRRTSGESRNSESDEEEPPSSRRRSEEHTSELQSQ